MLEISDKKRLDNLMKSYNENRVLRKIFGPRRDEVMGEWR